MGKKGQTAWSKGMKFSDEHRKKLSESAKKNRANPEVRKRLSDMAKKITSNPEWRKKHSNFMKNYYKNNKHPMLGRKQSKESIKKSVESRRITLLNLEVRKRISDSHKGQTAWNKGMKMSQEHRDKLYRNTIEQMHEIAKERGGKCLSDKYLGSGNRLKWGCERGHEWESTPHDIKSGKWCPTCFTKVGEKICKEYFETMFQEQFPKAHPNWIKNITGRNLELDGYCKKLGLAFEYQGEQHHKSNHYFNKLFGLEKIKQRDNFKKEKCFENKVTLIQVPHHINYEKLGKWIEEECKKNNFIPLISSNKIDYKNFDVYSSKDLKEMQEIAKSNGGKCLSGNYVGVLTKLRWQCGNGHIWESTPHSIKRGNWCSICSFERAKYDWKNQSGTASEFQKNELNRLMYLAKENGGICLSDKYLNNSTPLQWRCKENHIWKAKPSSIKRGSWCPICSYEYRGSLTRGDILEMKEIARIRGGKCLSDKFFNVDTRLKWQCGKGHIWEAVPSSIKRGSWCQKCYWKDRQKMKQK